MQASGQVFQVFPEQQPAAPATAPTPTQPSQSQSTSTQPSQPQSAPKPAKPAHTPDPEKPAKRKRRRFQLHKLKFHKVKTWVLLLILIPLLFLDATLLRIDHLRMSDLRTAVLDADAAEDDQAIADNLAALRDFTLSNIVINVIDDNGQQKVTFGTGPFYLEHQYIRDANAALEQAESELADDNNPYGNIYQAASEVCQPQAIANGWDWNTPDYINCMMGEIQKYPSSEDLTDTVAANLPSTELYRLNYASPLWAPTLSGFCLLITLILIVVIFIRFLTWIFLRVSLFFI